MTWLAILAGWVVLSVPVSLLTGRMLRARDRCNVKAGARQAARELHEAMAGKEAH